MLALKIKQIRTALTDGRLDEAAKLLDDSEIRTHRQGQELTTQLAAALVARGREHLEAGRLDPAMHDARLAQGFGGNQAGVAGLLADVSAAQMETLDKHGRRQQKLRHARNAIDEGRISVGEAMLAGESLTDTQLLLERARQRRDALEAGRRRVRDRLEANDPAGAAAILTESGLMSDPDLKNMVGDAVIAEMQQCFNTGRIDKAAGLVDISRPVCSEAMGFLEVERMLTLARQAEEAISAGQAREALGVLKRLAALVPEAGWVSQAAGAAEQAAQGMEHLAAGPLGLLGAAQWELRPQEVKAQPVAAHMFTVAKKEEARPMHGAKRWLVQVDGVGSFLVAPGNEVTLGPVSGSKKVDVAMITDPSAAVVTISRSEGDYFAAGRGLMVNSEPAGRKLLAEGDKVAVGRRGRLRFHRPNAASGTAVLELTSGRLAEADVRRVVLMDRELIVGPAATAHIRAEEMETQAVLVAGPGGLELMGKGPVALNEPVQLGSVSLVVHDV